MTEDPYRSLQDSLPPLIARPWVEVGRAFSRDQNPSYYRFVHALGTKHGWLVRVDECVVAPPVTAPIAGACYSPSIPGSMAFIMPPPHPDSQLVFLPLPDATVEDLHAMFFVEP